MALKNSSMLVAAKVTPAKRSDISDSPIPSRVYTRQDSRDAEIAGRGGRAAAWHHKRPRRRTAGHHRHSDCVHASAGRFASAPGHRPPHAVQARPGSAGILSRLRLREGHSREHATKRGDCKEFCPRLGNIRRISQVAFQTDRALRRIIPVYLPHAPNPWSGNVIFVSEERVKRLSGSATDAIKILLARQRFGGGRRGCNRVHA
jgi:hypothetical protein